MIFLDPFHDLMPAMSSVWKLLVLVWLVSLECVSVSRDGEEDGDATEARPWQINQSEYNQDNTPL